MYKRHTKIKGKVKPNAVQTPLLPGNRAREDERNKEELQPENDQQNGNKFLSIIPLTVNGPNAPVNRHRENEWIIKEDPPLCCLWGTHSRP